MACLFKLTNTRTGAHLSICTVVDNINSIFPASCNGSAACASVGRTTQQLLSDLHHIRPTRSLFGAIPSGEIIASPTDSNQAFSL
jgi:hypothetical protein